MGSNNPQGHGILTWNPFSCHINLINAYLNVMFACRRKMLEEISTQNGPPKKNNKIVVKIIK